MWGLGWSACVFPLINWLIRAIARLAPAGGVSLRAPLAELGPKAPNG